jgi:hypothetical protein
MAGGGGGGGIFGAVTDIVGGVGRGIGSLFGIGGTRPRVPSIVPLDQTLEDATADLPQISAIERIRQARARRRRAAGGPGRQGTILAGARESNTVLGAAAGANRLLGL